MWYDFFDKIYLINLPERRDRYWISTLELTKLSLKYEVIKAIKNIDGRQGLYQTMWNIFTDAVSKDYNRILIFEDDLKFVMDPGPVLEKCIAQLPEDFDLFYLGCNLSERPARFYSENLLPVTRALSTHAVAYSNKCMHRILSLPNFLPVDLFFAHSIQSAGKSFCACPLLVTQYPGYSNIEGRETDWTAVIERRFQRNVTPVIQQAQEQGIQCCVA